MIEHLLEPEFGGTIGVTVDQSIPWWPPTPTRAGRPDVVVVVLDDVGFAQLGCYGSEIRTPTIDALAARGVQFGNFHVTPLCSPTRACLLTGRNHHSVGMSMITGFPSGFPNGRERVSTRAAMLPAHLRVAGYGTYAIGKWHLGPMHEANPAGPFGDWPLAHGFDRFYGFLAGETDQFRPNLVRDNSVLPEPPAGDGYHLSEDLTDQAITMLATHCSATPDRPFFLYLAYGACHGPHHVPESHRESHAGMFDDGWDAARQRWFRRQLELGVVPAGTVLPPPNPDVPAWDDVAEADRPLFARFQELFAGCLHHTDAQIARLLAALERFGRADDTVFVVLSDNGAAGEGGVAGSWNELIPLNGFTPTAQESIARMATLGGPDSYPVYPRAWAQAGNTPGKWYKHYTFGGGVRAPLVVSWPAGLVEPGRIDHTFRHAVDLAPTLLELCRVQPVPQVDGVDQMPIHGASFAPTIRSGPTEPPRRAQYFEMGGHRGIYLDGWKATTRHTAGASFDDDVWELYDLTSDFSESRDLAAEHPDVLARLVARWWVEAGTYGVLPLDDRFLERALSREGQPNAGRRQFVFHRGTERIGEAALPSLHGGRYSVRVEIERDDGDEGVLVSYGGRHAGFVLYVADDTLHVEHNGFGTTDRASARLPAGRTIVGFDRDDAQVRLVIGDVPVAAMEVTRPVPFYAGGNGLEVGENRLSPVSQAYAMPASFTGRFATVSVELEAVEPRAGSAASAVRAD